METKNLTDREIVKDSGENYRSLQEWQDNTGAIFNWKTFPDGNWEVSFQICDFNMEIKSMDGNHY